MLESMQSVAVYCGSATGNSPAYTQAAQELGTELARRGLNLVYGGGNIGLMREVAQACLAAGGTVTGVGRYLKSKNADLHLVAVEPADSPVLSEGHAGPHKIQGIGANFVPEVLDRELLDEVMTATNEEAIETSRKLATEEGLLVGISAGANISAALKLAARSEFEGKTIVVVLPDFGERYVSTILFEDIREA